MKQLIYFTFKTNILLFFIIFFSFFSIKSSIKYKKQPNWDNSLNFKKVEKDLFDNIKEIRELLCNKPRPIFLVTLKNGLKGIFKSRSCNENLAERVAYKLSKHLNLNLVPPTVIRIINGKKGSLQFFVDSKLDLENQEKLTDSLDPKYISDISLFNFIFGKWDCDKGKNIIINQSQNNKIYPALIDNGEISKVQKSFYGHRSWIRVNKNSKPEYQKIINFNSYNIVKDMPEKIVDDFECWHFKTKWPNCKYVLGDEAVWIKFVNFGLELNFTNIYFRSTLKKYLRLNLELLKRVWRTEDPIYYQENKAYFYDLLIEVINRRNQILNHALKISTIAIDAIKTGTIIEDI